MSTRPPIFVTSRDADRLDALLDATSPRDCPGKAELQAEVDRAEVVEPEDMPPNVVTMNSKVRFRVVSTGERFELALVYPRDAGSSETVSILAPVGSALLGLSEGDEIEWPRPGGGSLKVQIEKVLYQPEREGEYHR
ncbi:GreA/GreB family elongation factor [Alkalispirillum mobile]|uniref:GreA/GreB family elongation factor n=1 Tax=Alkalispirillum mobile TaxID=85925 RepID=A0A498C2E7_9GAMM|nr:nucleoside diphosphate kinase regulator [Alkalispirillum mobile]RLK48806.1 GreA/GreB family elongation factor [Alkalispirillum mobile]